MNQETKEINNSVASFYVLPLPYTQIVKCKQETVRQTTGSKQIKQPHVTAE